MLSALSIKDIVLIDELELEFSGGLTVLTGETGAGKSIVLDALGLVLGERADTGLVRKGAERGVVAAEFEVPRSHPVHDLLREQGLEDEGEVLMLRRLLGVDGRSRAFVNDQPTSAGLMKQIGAQLVEIHGQHGQQGLMDARTHRGLLDQFGGLQNDAATVADRFASAKEAEKAYLAAQEEMEAARRDENYLRHAVDELSALDPQPGEEEDLATRRTLMMQGEQVGEDLSEALAELSGDRDGGRGADALLRLGLRRLERSAEKMGDRLDPVIGALDRAGNELDEAVRLLELAIGELEFDPKELERTEERLFALRAAARKYQCGVDDLPAVRDRLQEQLKSIDAGEGRLEDLREDWDGALEAYSKAASDLSKKRAGAATALDKAVMAELPPLKLEKAVFETVLEPLDRSEWSTGGAERVSFRIATNPGSAPGPLSRVASGGELSRFSLALKVVLSRDGAVPTLIFDEIDQGIGGATAAAVGDRLARLSSQNQVLVVTHSPQVAARAGAHLRVGKESRDGTAHTSVLPLSGSERQEEIARMLSGERITEEARAAADQLMRGEPV